MSGRPMNGAALNSGCRLLVMDDEDLLITFTARMLRRMGYEVEVASDGAEAIGRYTAAMEAGRPFDAVILDLTIPGGIGGEEALRKLCEIDAEVKAIASSGYSNDPVIADFAGHGFQGAIVKPYRIDEMGSVVSRVLGMRQPAGGPFAPAQRLLLNSQRT